MNPVKSSIYGITPFLSYGSADNNYGYMKQGFAPLKEGLERPPKPLLLVGGEAFCS